MRRSVVGERRESSSRESPAAIEQWIVDGPVSGLMSNQFGNRLLLAAFPRFRAVAFWLNNSFTVAGAVTGLPIFR